MTPSAELTHLTLSLSLVEPIAPKGFLLSVALVWQPTVKRWMAYVFPEKFLLLTCEVLDRVIEETLEMGMEVVFMDAAGFYGAVSRKSNNSTE